MKRILLVEPSFPIPPKSKNHSSFLPIGLLKLASYYEKKGHQVGLNRGNKPAEFYPDRILVTSLFTYWADYVRDAVQYYKTLYPDAKIEVGGIYATLMPDHCKKHTGCNKVFQGQYKGAEKILPAYKLVDVDYQIIHGMRGCINKCPFCGIWKIEKQNYKNAKQIKREICSNRLIFYDNNILANPNIDEILQMLSKTTYKGKVINCECQSGFDGRILMEKPHLAKMLREARFSDIRLAWDFPYTSENAQKVGGWIKLLENAGYKKKKIFMFMIYNWEYSFDHMEQKRSKCFEWGIQIADCRYRPLDQTFDRYNSHKKGQTSQDYYIHPNWTDTEIKQFRKNVRKHNICIRYNIPWDRYDQKLERINCKKKDILNNPELKKMSEKMSQQIIPTYESS
jgi:hypothetical protein